MRHFDRVLSDREQPVLGEPANGRYSGRISVEVELIQRHPAPRSGFALSDEREPEKDPPCCHPLDVRQLLVGRLRQPRHSAPHPAAVFEGRHPDPAAFAGLPQLDEGG